MWCSKSEPQQPWSEKYQICFIFFDVQTFSVFTGNMVKPDLFYTNKINNLAATAQKKNWQCFFQISTNVTVGTSASQYSKMGCSVWSSTYFIQSQRGQAAGALGWHCSRDRDQSLLLSSKWEGMLLCVCVCVCVCVCERKRVYTTQFLLDRLSTAVDRRQAVSGSTQADTCTQTHTAGCALILPKLCPRSASFKVFVFILTAVRPWLACYKNAKQAQRNAVKWTGLASVVPRN